jgi:hypothetical protein
MLQNIDIESIKDEHLVAMHVSIDLSCEAHSAIPTGGGYMQFLLEGVGDNDFFSLETYQLTHQISPKRLYHFPAVPVILIASLTTAPISASWHFFHN